MSNFERLIAKVVAQPIKPKVCHHQGMPEGLATVGNPPGLLPTAQFLLIEHNEDGVFLNRFLKDGSTVGDTWHESVEDAKDQAAFEYGVGESGWVLVPVDIHDVRAYALRKFL